MDKLKLKMSVSELDELHQFTELVSASTTPAVFRAADMGAEQYSGACAMAMLVNRLHARVRMAVWKNGQEVKMTIPAEEGHALVYAWLRGPRLDPYVKYMHLRNLVGRVQKELS